MMSFDDENADEILAEKAEEKRAVRMAYTIIAIFVILCAAAAYGAM